MNLEEKNKTPCSDALIAEYTTSHEAVIHHDNFAWSVGSVLIAASFVSWGLIFQNNRISDCILYFTSVVNVILMSIWLLYAHHTRQIYLSKLHRIHEIEKILKLKSNVGWIEKRYVTFGLKGNQLNILLYLLISLSSMIMPAIYLEAILKCWHIALIIFLLFLIILTILWFCHNEEKIQQQLNSSSSCASQSPANGG